MKAEEQNFFVGFDLGGTKMMAAVFDPSLRKLFSVRKKTKSWEGAKSGLARMNNLIEECLKGISAKPSRLRGIGIGCPGVLDLKKGILCEAANLGWQNVNLKKYFERKYLCGVSVINDVDAGTFGEYVKGAGCDGKRVVGIFPGTGIGGGCVVNGEIMMGEKNSCMEVGHICVVYKNGLKCGCGNYGCLETVASRLAISAQAACAAIRGQAPNLMRRCGSDIASIKSGDIVYAIKKGDKNIEDIVRRAAGWLGVGVSIVVNLIVPDTVVIGGGLVEAMPSFYIKEIRQSAEKYVMPSFRGSFRIVAAELGDDAVVTGAAAWARQSHERNRAQQ